MMMKKEQFNSLTLDEKGAVVFGPHAKFLAYREYYNHKATLYDCGEYFAEVFYFPQENKIVKIQAVESDQKTIDLYIDSMVKNNKLLAKDKSDGLFSNLDLPIDTIYCELNQPHREYYNKYKISLFNELRRLIKEKGFSNIKPDIIRSIHRLRIASFSTFFIDQKISTHNSIACDALLKELENRREQKVLIVSSIIGVVNLLSDTFKRSGLEYLLLTGKTRDRSSVLTTFNDPESNKNILLATKNSIVGTNITSDSCFILNTDGSKGELLRIITRNPEYRKALKGKCYAIVCKDTIDEKLVKLHSRYDSLDLLNSIQLEDLEFLFE